MTDFHLMRKIAEEDVQIIEDKDKQYGASWKRRGGVGAFMMLARKWDRIEELVKNNFGWDIFAAIRKDTRPEAILDDIRDLRRYLFLVETEMVEEIQKEVRERAAPIQEMLNRTAPARTIDTWDGTTSLKPPGRVVKINGATEIAIDETGDEPKYYTRTFPGVHWEWTNPRVAQSLLHAYGKAGHGAAPESIAGAALAPGAGGGASTPSGASYLGKIAAEGGPPKQPHAIRVSTDHPCPFGYDSQLDGD